MTKPNLARTLAVALTVCLAASGAALAQIGRGNAPIEIRSKSSEYFQNEGRGIWLGDVIATQGDSRITTDKLTAVCTKSAGGGGDRTCEEIEQLIAEGNVLYSAPDIDIRGDRAQYDYPTDTITITGDVISSRGDEGVVRGTQMVYNVGEGRVRITAGSDRVMSIINTKGRDTAPAPAPSTPPAPRPN